MTGSNLPSGVLQNNVGDVTLSTGTGCMDISQINVLDAAAIPNFHLTGSGPNPAQPDEFLQRVRTDFINKTGSEPASFNDVIPFLRDSGGQLYSTTASTTFEQRLLASYALSEIYEVNGVTGKTNVEDFLRQESQAKGGL